MLYAAFVVYIF